MKIQSLLITFFFSISINLFSIPRISQVDNSSFTLNTQIKIYVNADGNKTLEKNNFKVMEKIRENKTDKWVERDITGFNKPGENNKPINFILLLDVSGSMAGTRILQAKNALISFLNKINKNDNVKITTFGKNIQSSVWFENDKQKAVDYVNNLPQIINNAPTPLYHAVKNASDELKTINGRKALIVLSDGENDLRADGYNDLSGFDNIPHTDLRDVVKKTRESGIPVYTIGFESRTNSLYIMSLNSGGLYFPDVKGLELNLLYEKIRQSIESEYELTFKTDITGYDARELYVIVNNSKSNTRLYYAGSLFGQHYELSLYLLFALIAAIVIIIILYFINFANKNKNAFISVIKGKASKKKVTLNLTPVTIGKDEKSNIGLFGDKQVELKHAKIYPKENGKYVIENISQANPVYVNKKEIQKAILSDGAVIQIGNSILLFNEKEIKN